jgi:NADH-quinone oxidoreductase subunit H
MNSTIATYLLQYEIFQKSVDWMTGVLGHDATSTFTFLVMFAFGGILLGAAATIGGLGTYAERKISADLQQRIGPNRVGPYGLGQLIADALKMLTKEDIMPKGADKFLFYFAPFLALLGVFSTLAVLPFSDGFTMSHLNVGVFYLVAISSLVGLSVFLGGYASNSKWSMLGGMRGASQIISYEIPVTISILGIALLSGGMSFSKIVGAQGGLPHTWFVFHNPFGFISFFVFFIGLLAETNRAPFDLPEAESELVSGFHTEYTGLRFGFFALAEFTEVFIIAALAACLFLGGYNVPFGLGNKGGPIGQLLQVGSIVTKAFAIYYVVIWIRWTFPRLRVDQLMSLCWKYLTPIAIFNLIGMAIWMVVFNGKSIYELIAH